MNRALPWPQLPLTVQTPAGRTKGKPPEVGDPPPSCSAALLSQPCPLTSPPPPLGCRVKEWIPAPPPPAMVCTVGGRGPCGRVFYHHSVASLGCKCPNPTPSPPPTYQPWGLSLPCCADPGWRAEPGVHFPLTCPLWLTGRGVSKGMGLGCLQPSRAALKGFLPLTDCAYPSWGGLGWEICPPPRLSHLWLREGARGWRGGRDGAFAARWR